MRTVRTEKPAANLPVNQAPLVFYYRNMVLFSGDGQGGHQAVTLNFSVQQINGYEVMMEIRKVELDSKVGTFIETEQEKFESKHGVLCNYTPFCFTATLDDEIIGVISGATFFSEVYIDELVVKDEYRGKGIGTQLIKAVEESFSGQDFITSIAVPTGFRHPGSMRNAAFSLSLYGKTNPIPS